MDETRLRTLLTPQAVDDLMMRTLLDVDEPEKDAMLVHGVDSRYHFHVGRLTDSRQAIADLLRQLPLRCWAGATGTSFSKLGETLHGRQWGERRSVDALVCLAIGSGQGCFVYAREHWHRLPGGVPNVKVSVELSGKVFSHVSVC